MSHTEGVWSVVSVGVSAFATWWLYEYQQGKHPELQLTWLAVKTLRATRRGITAVEGRLLSTIDTMLEV